MGKKTAPAPPAEYLSARIDTVAQTYFISADDPGPRVEDEAILSLVGVIERISPRYERFLGQSLEMAFVCARSFQAKEPTPKADRPLLLPLELRKDRRSFMTYLPGDAFWALCRMIPARLVTHVEARFSGLRYGTADLLSVYFSGERQQG